MKWIWYCWFSLIFCLYIAADLLEDINKYNNNFDQMITTDYERLVQLKDVGVQAFAESGGVAAKVVSLFMNSERDTLDDVHRKAATTLLHGITERSRRVQLNSLRLFDLLSIDSLEDIFDEVIDTPLATGYLLLDLANTVDKGHAKEQLLKYCTDINQGPLTVLNNLAIHTYNNCRIPSEANVDYYYRAASVFQKIEKEFVLDHEYRVLKQGMLNFALFEGDVDVVEEKIRRKPHDFILAFGYKILGLEVDDIIDETQVIPKLKDIGAGKGYGATCWLEKVFTHNHQKVLDYENFGVIVMMALVKIDDMLMSCSGMNDTLSYYLQKAKQWTSLINTHIDLFKKDLVKRVWPNGVEKRVKSILPVTTLSPSKYNATTTAVKHAINLMVEKSTKFHVILTSIMDTDTYYTNCIHKTDCLVVQSADAKAYVFKSKYGLDTNKTQQAEKYFSTTCRKPIKKVIKKNAGENPAFIWPLIQKACPKLLHFYRHIFFGTGFKSEGLMKIGWSYSAWNSYQHIHKYYEKEASVTGQEYHFFALM